MNEPNEPEEQIFLMAGPEELRNALDVIIQHMWDSIRMVCVERQRMRCFPCVLELTKPQVNQFFERNPPASLEEMDVNEYMSRLTRFARRTAARAINKYQCTTVDVKNCVVINGNETQH